MGKKVRTAWRIIERGEDRQPRTLFHGNQGSRILPRGRWLVADEKEVHDGSAGTPYISGWHVLLSLEATHQYLERFNRDLRQLEVIQVEVRGKLRRKEHSRSEVYLAREMRI